MQEIDENIEKKVAEKSELCGDRAGQVAVQAPYLATPSPRRQGVR